MCPELCICSALCFKKQDNLPLTLRGNTDHYPHPSHARTELAGGGGDLGGGVRSPGQVTPSPPNPKEGESEEGRGGVTWSGYPLYPARSGQGTPSPVDRRTDLSENIPFPRTTYVVGNNLGRL